MKKAFLVIVDYKNERNEPFIGDIGWAVRRLELNAPDWGIHTTEATAEMLAHHGVPYPTPENVEGPSTYYTNELVQVDSFGRPIKQPSRTDNVEGPT